MAGPKIDRIEDFESWLLSKDPGAVVGTYAETDGCPLAWYLREQGAPAPWVRIDWYECEHEFGVRSRDWKEIPAWAAAFIRRLDLMEPDPGEELPDDAYDVQAHEALRVLAEVKKLETEGGGGT